MSRDLLSVFSGLGGMFGWGTSDFFANTTSEKIGNIRTLFYSQCVGVLLLILALCVVHPVFSVTANLLPFIFLTGIGYSFGYLFYYRAFEVGNLSVASVVINLNAVFTMIVVFLFMGERLSGIQIPAIALALLGVTLVSINFADIKGKKGSLLFAGAKEALIASVFFGVLSWGVTDYLISKADWLWIAFFTKITALAIVFVVSKVRKTDLTLPHKTTKKLWLSLFLVGALEAGAILCANFGFAMGKSILVAPIANSVAVVTVALAVIFLKEKLTKIQIIGMVFTIVGIILTAF